MRPIDFSIFYKKKYSTLHDFTSANCYDILISAYNDSERVKKVFDEISASQKHWLVFPEYQYTAAEIPAQLGGTAVFNFTGNSSRTEGEIIREYFSGLKLSSATRICIDITGFIRPHLIFLVRFLASAVKNPVDFIYTDPVTYKRKEDTFFSFDYTDVRQVEGFQGVHNPDSTNDYLIIGSGYDDQRITDVSKKKANAKKVQLFGFPSLQPDMFQENILKAYKAEEASSSGRENFIDKDATLFAPANDPFITANVIKEYVDKEERSKSITNLYLSPLSTKAQTLGFAIYFLAECEGKPASIIFPFCDHYSRETTEGISKIWKYTIGLNDLLVI